MFIGCTAYVGCRYLLNGSNIVCCDSEKVEKPSANSFDWDKLLLYLSPDLFNLLAAIAVSIY